MALPGLGRAKAERTTQHLQTTIAVLYVITQLCAADRLQAGDLVDSYSKLALMPGVPELMSSQQRDPAKLVFDVGFNDGKDSRIYAANGYTIVGLDADVQWVDHARETHKDLVDKGRLLVLHAGVEERVGKPLVFWRNTELPVLSSFEKEKACPHGGSNGECEALEVPLLRCEALWLFGKPEYLKVDIEERHFTCVKSLVNLPKHLLPTYISWEMHEYAKKMPYPFMDARLLLTLWDLGYDWVKIVTQEVGSQTAGMPDAVPNFVTGNNEWSLLQDVLRGGLTYPRDLHLVRWDADQKKNVTFQPWFDFVMKLNDHAYRDTGAETDCHASRDADNDVAQQLANRQAAANAKKTRLQQH